MWIHWEPLGHTSTHDGPGTWAVFQRNEAVLELEHRVSATAQHYSDGEKAHKSVPLTIFVFHVFE